MPWSGKQFRTLNCVPAGHPKNTLKAVAASLAISKKNKYRFPLQIQKLARPLEEFGACSSTEVESKVCVSSAIPLGANYVGGCSHKSDFTIDLTEAFDFLDSQATGGVFQLRHELSCLMSGPERSLLRMTLQLIQLLTRSACLQTVHVTSHNQLHHCLTLSWSSFASDEIGSPCNSDALVSPGSSPAISTTGGANDGPRNQLRTLKAGMMIPAFTRRNSHMIRKTGTS